MSPEQVKLREIFSEALTKASPEERERYLVAACGGDADLRRQIDVLLEAHVQSGDFLHHNVIAPNGPPIGEGPGSVIGRYKLLQQIGEGGFGVVFMAEQQEPVRRMVALKILKAGLDTKEVVARFEAGRQALALMDHPNIARVLDGGATDSGRPFFVMELIKGIPITEFCEQHQLPIKARLQLFMKVCAGVQHAHQKGVIHRDLKPSNVLVTLHDGEPVPKVIDFGIAKAIGQKLTERTLFTRFEQLIGTPAYMSPEQAEWSGLDIDTRSDLYSLGVLLYELLTGTTPLEKETLARAALDEMRRMIRETEPPKPSTRLEAGLRGQKSEVRGQRSEVRGQMAPSQSSTLDSQLSDSASLRRRLQAVRGDLDWIVMKALEKDRMRRYETVNGLARDIERHLNGEPVVACPPSKVYLAGKFIRKHHAAVVAVSAVALALVAGLVLALAGFAQARRHEKRAQDEAAIAKAVNDFLLKDLLGQANPNTNPNRDLKLREVLDRAAENIKDKFTNQPLVEASIQYTIGNSYVGLGEIKTAEPHVRRALAIRKQELGPEHPDTVDALDRLAACYWFSGRKEESEPLFRQVCEASRKALGAEHPTTLYRMWILATTEISLGRYAEAEDLLREVLEKQQRVLGGEDKATLRTRGALAVIYRRADRPSECAEMLEGVLSALRRTQASEREERAEVMENLGSTYLDLANYPRAAELYGTLVEMHDRTGGPHDAAALYYRRLLATAYGGAGEWALCVQLCRGIAASTNGPHGRYSYECEQYGATAALMAGDTSAFREFAGRLLARCAGTTNTSSARTAAQICMLAPDALADLAPALDLAAMLPAGRPRLNGSKLAKAMAQYRLGHFAEVLKYCEGWRRMDSLSTSSKAGLLSAMAYQGQGNTAAAQADLAEAGKRVASFLRTGELDACGDFNFGWQVFRAAFLRAEAERLILGREVSPRLDAAWLAAARRQWQPIRRRLDQAGSLAGQRQWAQARNEYLALLGEAGFDWEAAYGHDYRLPAKMGITFLLAGDPTSYQRICRHFLTRLEDYDDRVSVADLVPVCLACETNLLGDLGPKAITWAEAIETDPSFRGGATGLYHMLGAYRSGQYQKVINEPKTAEEPDSLAVRSAARIFRGMALARLGRVGEGKKQLAQAEAQLGPHLATMTGDHWCDLGLCQLALDEAHRLFGDTPRKQPGGGRHPPSLPVASSQARR